MLHFEVKNDIEYTYKNHIKIHSVTKGGRHMKKRGLIITIGIALAVVGAGGAYKYIDINTKVVSASAEKDDGKVDKQNEDSEFIKEPIKIDENAIVPGNNIIYSAQKYAVPANDVLTMLNGKSTDGTKQVFLTFDDGPSKHTPEILNILKEEGVHATFFVLGSALDESPKHTEYLKREIKEGNAIANHTYSHDFKKLYPHNSVNVNTFMSELDKTNQIMRNILGKDFDTNVIRMPGGYMSREYYKDSNLPALDNAFKSSSIVSIDWDGENGDATGKKYTPQELVNNAIKQTKDDTHVILLMHDSANKQATVDSLRDLINYYKSSGYEFKVISNSIK